MGRFQPKAHPRWFISKEDKTWLYVIMAFVVIILIILMIKI